MTSPDPIPWPRGQDGPPLTPDHVVISQTVWNLEFAVDAAAHTAPEADAPDVDFEPGDVPARGGGGTSIIDDILGAFIDVELFFGRW